MAEKKKKSRRAYLDSFKKKSDGTYVYEGIYYVFAGVNLRRDVILLCILGAAMLAAVIAAGCVSAPGTGTSFYVLLPYAANLVAVISVCWGIGRLAAGGDSLREYVYHATVRQIPGRAVFAALCAGVATAGEIVFVFRNGIDGKSTGCTLFLGLEIAVLILSVCICKCVLQMRWKTKQDL